MTPTAEKIEKCPKIQGWRVWILALFVVPLGCAVTQARSAAPKPAVLAPAVALAFSDFFQPGAHLIPTQRVLQAQGKRVRLVGFMARMELASSRAFFLASRPLVCDEAGGGTADLTPDAVRVEVPWAHDPAIPFVAGPVEVVGTFHIGSHEEMDGRVSMFRVTLDPPSPSIAAAVPDSDRSKSHPKKTNDSRS